MSPISYRRRYRIVADIVTANIGNVGVSAVSGSWNSPIYMLMNRLPGIPIIDKFWMMDPMER
jgi:hypothetical protein